MRLKLLFFALLVGLFATTFLSPKQIYSQTTGSIGGIVIDAGTKTPIEGAIVKIEGSNRGAETDVNGEYVILNVDVGEYTVVSSATLSGYGMQKQTGVRVSVDQRTKLNFELVNTGGIKTDTVEVVAQRKGIDVEQSGRNITSEQIKQTGIRGIQNIVSKTAGVIQSNDATGKSQIYIRGGRSSENLIIVDGVATTNPQDGSNSAFISNSQLNEIAVLTGGFGAEYGNALSGVINVTTKSGTDKYSGSFEVISDVAAGDWIKTKSQGYNVYNFTLGGPLIPTKSLSKVINFFGGAERQYLQVATPSWIADQLFDNGQPPNLNQKIWSYNGKLNFNFNEIKGSKIPIQLKTGFSYTDNYFKSYRGSFLKFNSERFRYNTSKDLQAFGRISHTVSQKFFYELQGSYYKSKGEFGDPLFKDDWFAYGDTSRVSGLRTQGGTLGSDPTGVFRLSGAVNDFFQRTEISYIGGKLDATWALLTKKAGDHEIKFGGEFRYNTLRKMLFFASAIAVQVDSAGNPLVPILDKWYSGSSGRLKAYGYTINDHGTEVITGDDVNPKHPIVGAFYIRDKVDFQGFSFNGGVRVDYLDVNSEVLKSTRDVLGNDGVLLSDDDYEKSKPIVTVSPRLGFSFPITDKTVFVAQFGKFIQLPPLDYLYINRIAFQQFFNTALQDVAENSSLKPEKLTSYEVGVKHQVGDYLNLGVTAYYKETRDQIGINKIPLIPNKVPIGYTLYENSDFSVSRGLDFYLSLRRFNRLSMDVAYTLLYASGTGSDPNQKLNLVNQSNEYPNFTFPLDYDQRHTGSINLDYRFGGDEDVPKGFWGQILKRMGLNILFSFGSGKPYTQRTLPSRPFDETSGAATSTKNQLYTSWSTSIDLKLDKTVKIWKTNWNFYIYVINLFNSELVNKVYGATGRPDDDGYLNSPAGSISVLIPGYVDNYNLRQKLLTNWGPPRQIRLGVNMLF